MSMFDLKVSALALGRLPRDLAAFAPTHVLSVVDPGQPVDLGACAARHAIVRFEDVLEDGAPGGMTPADGETIVVFVEEAVRADARLLVHCHHGQSRSTAVAFAAAAIALGAGREREAFSMMVRAAAGRPWPNQRVVAALDARLGRGGALTREVDAYRARFRPGRPP
jgi:predicted protein tyrosine phosphatase